MKFFQKRGVAIAVLILAIIASGAWGLHKAPAVSTPEGGEKLDPSLSTAAFTQYVRDDADVLSDKTEEAIGLYNANWDKMFGSIMAVVTTESANDIENAAYDYAIEMQLAENDAILVIAKQQQDYYLLASGNFYDLLSRLSQSFVASCMADNVQKGDYDAAVRSLCAALHVELSQQYQQSEAALDEAANGVMFIMILIIFFIIWIMLDGMRYRRYRRRYMMPGMGIPTVVYRPIFWGRRPPRSPRPPRSGGPRPPQGGPRPPYSGGSSGGHHRRPTVTIPDDVPTGLNGDDHYAYIVGYPNGNVEPNGNITRAEVATIFFRLLTEKVRTANSTQSNSLSDVSRGQWFNHAISTLSSMGIVKGNPDGTFDPDAPITRAEFAAIAARFDDKNTDTSSKFTDIASHWAKNEIGIAANKGWINGYPDGTFRPNQYITRAEAMTLVNRVLNRLPENSSDLLDSMIKWPDNSDASQWFYLAVQEATNSHYYKTKENKFEKWTKLRETRDWTELEK